MVAAVPSVLLTRHVYTPRSSAVTTRMVSSWKCLSVAEMRRWLLLCRRAPSTAGQSRPGQWHHMHPAFQGPASPYSRGHPLPSCHLPRDIFLPLVQVACAAGWADTWQARVTDWPRTTVSSESSRRKDGAREGSQTSLQSHPQPENMACTPKTGMLGKPMPTQLPFNTSASSRKASRTAPMLGTRAALMSPPNLGPRPCGCRLGPSSGTGNQRGAPSPCSWVPMAAPGQHTHLGPCSSGPAGRKPGLPSSWGGSVSLGLQGGRGLWKSQLWSQLP